MQEVKMTFDGMAFAVQFDIESRETAPCDYCKRPGIKHRVVIIKISTERLNIGKDSRLFKIVEEKTKRAFLDGHALCTRDSKTCTDQFNQELRGQCVAVGVSLDSDFFKIAVKE